jgi:hypothetical protein
VLITKAAMLAPTGVPAWQSCFAGVSVQDTHVSVQESARTRKGAEKSGKTCVQHAACRPAGGAADRSGAAWRSGPQARRRCDDQLPTTLDSHGRRGRMKAPRSRGDRGHAAA